MEAYAAVMHVDYSISSLLAVLCGGALSVMSSCLVHNIIWLVCMMLSKTCMAVEEANSCASY